MRATRLHYPDQLSCGETTVLDANASNHLIRVLRTKINTDIILFNGDGFNYLCKTLDTNSKKTSIEVLSQLPNKNESNLIVTLIQGISRQHRMETTIQKSVELGVNKIIPVICQRSNTRSSEEKSIKKLQHWRKTVVSACEQSGRSIIPEITNIVLLDDLIPLLNYQATKFNLNPVAEKTLRCSNDKPQLIEIFIGPEGGLNDEESTFLNKNDFIDVNFGPRVLRTETAGPAVICALQILWGDI